MKIQGVFYGILLEDNKEGQSMVRTRLCHSVQSDFSIFWRLLGFHRIMFF